MFLGVFFWLKGLQIITNLKTVFNVYPVYVLLVRIQYTKYTVYTIHYLNTIKQGLYIRCDQITHYHC